MYTVHQDAFIKVNQQGENPVQYINTKNIINMERINMEDARIRVEFRKNETGEVIKIVEFEDIPEELQLPDSLPNETIDLCKYFYTGDDEYFKEAFFYWLDNYHYKLLDSDISK